MLHTTFRKAKGAGACIESYKHMKEALGGTKNYGLDTPIPLDKVLEVCGLENALWALRIVIEPADRELRLFACDCAERVLPIFEKQHPDDKRPRETIETSRRFALGGATQQELEAARDAAWDAAWDAWNAAWAARAAAWAAWDAAWDAAGDAAGAAGAAAGVAGRAAAGAAGRAAAWREWQRERFIRLLNSTGEIKD